MEVTLPFCVSAAVWSSERNCHRNECDDLRALESKVIVKAVTDARSAQIIEHEQRKVEEAEGKVDIPPFLLILVFPIVC